MATYLILNLCVIAVIVSLVFRRVSFTRLWLPLVILLVMTAIFDNLIVGLGIVDYDSMKILGVFFGFVPIEDFFYAMAAIILVPVLWARAGKHE